MDLATKGEAPFAHLIKTQVQMQPATKERSPRYPNAGRKSLIFSDGRQKAARLARDIPRETERDVFRQLIAMAVQALDSEHLPSNLDRNLFVAFIHVISQQNVVLFDGANQETLLRLVHDYRRDFGENGDLREAIDQGMTPMPQYWASLLRQIGPGYYTLTALTLAYVEPTAAAMKQLKQRFPSISQIDLDVLINVWIQGLLNRYAFNVTLPTGIRINAGGYGTVNVSRGFHDKERKILARYFQNIEEFEKSFQDVMSTPGGSGIFLRPERVRLRLAFDRDWIRCSECTAVSPFSVRDHYPNCGGEKIQSTSADQSDYLRARKTFWRDPVIGVLEQRIEPFNLSVEEHTAQLGYRDVDEPTSTTEEFERRFRDITKPRELPVDVLSSTTTMEVGIDIGSLVAVALRNVPPMRQNYQQRAGRTGRRGSAVSTVITFAQNSPHDNHYFEHPKEIISGDPPLPAIDVRNAKIIARHVHAALIQRYFHEHLPARESNDLFSMLGTTWDFYNKNDQDFCLVRFSDWLKDPVRGTDTYPNIENWIPDGVDVNAQDVGLMLIEKLRGIRPIQEDHLGGDETKLIEFLFTRGLLPSYAFPRDLCALQIEKPNSVKIEERPQQGLAVALTEYAPGRLVVVNKKTYRIGSVAASVASTVRDRAAPLFDSIKRYLTCPECSFTTQTIGTADRQPQTCPMCAGDKIYTMIVIQPEVVFPDGRQEIDELDDEQVITYSSPAQFPVVSQDETFDWKSRFAKASVAAAQNQQLVMVNAGQPGEERPNGFWVCRSCGKTNLDDSQNGVAHSRDYSIEVFGRRPPGHCTGVRENVFLGYSFSTDVMLMRVSLTEPMVTNVTNRIARRPMEAALSSLVEALSLSAAHILDIDPRELSGGHRFVRVGGQTYADLFLFDTLAGGAGYAHMAANDVVSIFEDAVRRLSECNCDQSCNKCLRHYGNRFKHADLDRRLALDLIWYIQSARIPAIGSVMDQKRLLEPLGYMLRLDGWSVEYLAETPLSATKENRRLRLGVYPALLDPDLVDPDGLAVDRMISAFDLKSDLPGVFSSTGN